MPLKAGACSRRRYLRLDLDEYASRHNEAVEGFNRTRRRLENVDHALVRAHFELLAALLVDVRAAENGVAFHAGRNRDGAANPGVGPLGVVDDFLRRLV